MTMKKGATQAVSSMNQAMMSCCISKAFSARLAGWIGRNGCLSMGGRSRVEGRGWKRRTRTEIKRLKTITTTVLRAGKGKFRLVRWKE